MPLAMLYCHADMAPLYLLSFSSSSSTRWSNRLMIPDPEQEGSSKRYSTLANWASSGLVSRNEPCTGVISRMQLNQWSDLLHGQHLAWHILLHPALLVNFFNNSKRLESRSKAQILPVFFINAERCEVLFPGAAQASIAWAPLGAWHTWAGKHDALSYRCIHIELIYFFPLLSNSVPVKWCCPKRIMDVHESQSFDWKWAYRGDGGQYRILSACN